MWLSRWPGWSSRISGASRIERRAGVDDDRERLVLDVDQLQRVARRVAVVGDHERDLLALEADLVGREHRLRVAATASASRRASRASRSAPGDDGVDLRVLERGGGVDRHDPGVGERAAQDRAVQHARQLHVVDERALAADEARVLLAAQATEADRAIV